MGRVETQISRRSFLTKVGLNPDHLTEWRKKWKGLKQTSVKRGSDFNLSFEDYVKIAVESGLTHYDQIGRTLGKHGMARYGDKGSYIYGNCRFITTTENIAERTINGGTQSQIEKMSEPFIAISPDGVEFKGENLTKFTRDMGLSNDYLGKVARGVHKSRLGWQCKYLEKEKQ